MTALTVEQIAEVLRRHAYAGLTRGRTLCRCGASADMLGGSAWLATHQAEQVAALGAGDSEVAPAELIIWAEGATPEQRQVIYDAAVDAAFDASADMDGVAIAAVGSLADGVDPWVEVTDEGGEG